MNFQIIIEIILLGIALSMDAFMVSITSGLTYVDINKKKSVFIATVFGFMQGFMPLIGYWLVEIVSSIVGSNGGERAGTILSYIVAWIAFSLLLFIGIKMLLDGIKEIKMDEEDKKPKKFSIKEVLYLGVATSIDALATGVALHSGLSTNYTIWLHVSIIIVITFIFSLIGLFLGKQIVKLMKGKVEIAAIIGGCILIALAVWIIISFYTGI